ncbi:ferredoxin [Amaricoccus solimangrovi]|uniref:Ferredoxin n=1 Tax=Amaricoccus solimangrovi TaxID=2589815 RepID=A0A501WXB9_9RHOB|nr:ferredoxin [Amaricoccus solimangrovi]
MAADGLVPLDAFHPGPDDGVPEGHGTLVLLGPGPEFWNVFSASAEYADGRPDPLDRWSARVIGGQAEALGGLALFPFGGPPWHPFIAWARRGGQVWQSPVGLLVHRTAGLFVSFRGAIALAPRLALPPPAGPPCTACAAPCRGGCPVDALGAAGYDIARCHAHLDTEAGRDCLSRGCAARRACPVGAGAREARQSEFHMTAFHPGAAR